MAGRSVCGVRAGVRTGTSGRAWWRPAAMAARSRGRSKRPRQVRGVTRASRREAGRGGSARACREDVPWAPVRSILSDPARVREPVRGDAWGSAGSGWHPVRRDVQVCWFGICNRWVMRAQLLDRVDSTASCRHPRDTPITPWTSSGRSTPRSGLIRPFCGRTRSRSRPVLVLSLLQLWFASSSECACRAVHYRRILHFGSFRNEGEKRGDARIHEVWIRSSAHM